MAAAVSLVTVLWWTNTDDTEAFKEIHPTLPVLKNTKPAITQEILFPPQTEAKPTGTLVPKEPQVEIQPESRNQSTIVSIREAPSNGNDRAPSTTYDTAPEVTPTPEALGDPEMQQIIQQLQAMRDAGLDDVTIRDAEEKLTQTLSITQRLRDQQSISKPENTSEDLL